MEIKKVEVEEGLYLVYRPFRLEDNGLVSVLQPGAKIRCTKLTAMCVNTMQPLTLREIKEQ